MIPKEIAELQHGVLVAHVGTRDSKLRTREIHCWAVTIDPPSDLVTVFVSEKLSGPTLSNVADNKKMAVVITDPLNHNSYQVKGDYISHHACSDTEHEKIKEKISNFYDGYLQPFGYPPEITSTFAYKPFVAITFKVNSAFNQTPGPNAGKQLDL